MSEQEKKTENKSEPVVISLTPELEEKLFQAKHAAERKEGFIQKYWRPTMAVLYLLLMLLDYGIRPVVNQAYAKEFNLPAVIEEVKKVNDTTVQLKVLEVASRKEIWPPILPDNVHLAFGAILTVAAGTRGWEKVEREKANKPKT